MARCDFCGGKIEQGTGKKFVRKDGKVFDFCSMKCEKATLKLNRKPHLTRWTLSFARDKRTRMGAEKQHAAEAKEVAPKQKKKAKAQ